MADTSDNGFTFTIGESGDLEWSCIGGWPALTTEQAMVIAHARGLSKIATAIDGLAYAIDAIAEKMRHPDDA